jgi:beta-lactamase regulating signal transducer with metallopeptidase domain
MGTEGGAGAGTARFDGADLTRLLVAGWLVGSMVVLAHAAIAVLRQRQLTARSVPPSSALRVLAEELSEAYRMARPRLVVSSAVDLPFVACGLRPVIVWPAAFDAPYAVEPFRPVLAHELAHLRRRDPWVAWVELGALVVQWWNPLVWLIRARLHETRELACDALALRTAPGRRRDFAELLLGLAGAEPLPRWPVPRVRTAWMSRHALKRRLTMVFDDRVDGESTAVGRVLAGLAALMFVPAWSLGQAPPRAEATPPPVAPPAATAPTASAPVAATATPTDAPLPATAPSAFVRQQATAPTAAVLPEGIAASPEARQPVGSGATVAAANLPDAGSAGVAPGDVLQVVDLGPEEGMLRVLRVCPGVVDIEISREGQRVSLMRMATAVGAPVAVNPASEPEDRPPVASMPVRSAPAASPPAGVVISADGRFVRLTQPDGTTRVVPAERAAPVVAADPFAVAPSVESSPISGGSSPNLELHRELRYRVEMAEIELEEKRAELDLALQIAESEPTARSKHAVRVAELAVKRADIAYRRALGLFESAATVPAVPPPPTQPRR